MINTKSFKVINLKILLKEKNLFIYFYCTYCQINIEYTQRKFKVNLVPRNFQINYFKILGISELKVKEVLFHGTSINNIKLLNLSHIYN